MFTSVERRPGQPTTVKHPIHRLAILASLIIALDARAQVQSACTAASFGPASPVTISGSWAIGNGCVLDFGSRHVILAPSAALSIEDATIVAGSFEAQAGSVISSSAAGFRSLTLITLGSASSPGDVMMAGLIDLSATGQAGGDVWIVAAGSVALVGSGITVAGMGDGGHVLVSAGGTADIGAPIIATGTPDPSQAPPPSGGLVSITAPGTIQITAPLDVGVIISAPNSTQAPGGLITLTSSGSGIVVGSNIGLRGGTPAPYPSPPNGVGAFHATCAGPYTQTGLIDASAACASADGGSVSINAGGFVSISGTVNTRAFASMNQTGKGGPITIHGGTGVQLGGVLTTLGWTPGYVHLDADSGDVTIGGAIHVEGWHGSLQVISHRDLFVTGPILGAWGGANGGTWVSLTADRTLIVSSLIDVMTEIASSVSLRGCRVQLATSGAIHAGTVYGGGVSMEAGDLLEVYGTVDLSSSGMYMLRTRLAAPYSPILGGSPTFPPPTVIHDNAMPPCLALTTASLSGPSPLVPGDDFIVDLESVPLRQVLVVANLSQFHYPLGSLGWTQVDPFSAAVLADFGALGPPIPGSSTDASGHWGVAIPTPASATYLIGLTFYVEALVMDGGAANGVFHQPPAIAISF